LSQADVVGVDDYLRRRGGSVVLLLDQHVPGPYERLMETGAWSSTSLGAGIPIAAAMPDSMFLRATEIAWPNVLPAGARALAQSAPGPRTSPDTGHSRAVVWRSPAGAGRLVVSGALDAWRFRDPAVSGFERFWQTTIADAASASPPPLSLVASTNVLAPGEETDVAVTIRSTALHARSSATDRSLPIAASVSAAAVSPANSGGTRSPLRLWPSSAVGEFHGVFRAPATSGVYRILASADGATADIPIVVAAQTSRVAPSAHDMLATWVGARGGRVLSESDPATLRASLIGALHPSPRVDLWHPMRSVWWMLPFTLALSAEWWLRRRRGLA
jgi:hypothetical protein